MVSSRGLSPLVLYDAACAAREVDGELVPEVVAAVWLRCDEVRGGGMGAPGMETAGAAMTGDAFVVERFCARGVFRVEVLDAAGEWCVCGVVGVLGDTPFAVRCEGFLELLGEAATGEACVKYCSRPCDD